MSRKPTNAPLRALRRPEINEPASVKPPIEILGTPEIFGDSIHVLLDDEVARLIVCGRERGQMVQKAVIIMRRSGFIDALLACTRRFLKNGAAH